MSKIKAITILKDEKYLRQKSKLVDLNDPSLIHDIQILEEYSKQNKVFAIAAVQLGIPKRLIYIKNTNLEIINKTELTEEEQAYNEARLLINPEIIQKEGLTDYWEACASCLNYMGHVQRPYKITVQYFNLEGTIQIDIFEGFEATVLSHEMDHLDGILHIDIATEILEKTLEERVIFRKDHNYNIVSKNGDYENLKSKAKQYTIKK